MPVTPNALQKAAEVIKARYSNAELALLGAMAARLGRGLSSYGLAQRKRVEERAMRKEAERIIRELERESKTFFQQQVEAAYSAGAHTLRADLAALRGALSGDIVAGRQDKTARLLQEIMDGIHLQHTRILRNVDDEYRRIIGWAVSDMENGGGLKASVQRSLNQFAQKGISSFTDVAGRNWGMAEYAEMSTRTGLMRSTLAGYLDTAIADGDDLVLVSDHSDECPLCSPWENKVLSITGAMRSHPDCDGLLSDAIAAGLFHPNCLHTLVVYIPGITRIGGGDPQTPEQNREGYKNRQKQRYYERQVRAGKRAQAVALDPFAERQAKSRVDGWQEKLRALTGETGLARMYGREGGRVTLSDKAIDLLREQRNAEGQWQRYVARLGGAAPKTLEAFIDLKRAGGDEWSQIQSIYRFAGYHGAANPTELLSNHKQAFGVLDKLTTYALNPLHDSGKNKAIVFESALGYNLSNSAVLETEIRKGLAV